ncbi:hypothetical protein HPB47_012686 [Ixodes persulcatus]|uniref:Uncharacterized protein n=1 Tax=Ixodes persulcatus TaxID=34615 RepID=A0AC60NSV5_IXOPE|nr:hypothetical protein HPB47_012686 [Ixodes persulcatus]
MSGVSFHKGCYIGQELTARTHHTGVVQKRIMPVVLLNRADGGGVVSDTVVKDGNDKAVNKFRVHRGQVGLALLRVDEALSAAALSAGSVRLSMLKPGWWPPIVSKRQIEGQRSLACLECMLHLPVWPLQKWRMWSQMMSLLPWQRSVPVVKSKMAVKKN